MGISEVASAIGAVDATTITAIATVVMCLVTAVMTRATWRIAKANQQMIKAGETPRVVVFLDFNPMPIEEYKFDIVLANIGQGPAKDVSFEFDPGDNDISKDISKEQEHPHIKMLATMGDMFFEWIPQGYKVVVGSIYHTPQNIPSPCKVRVKYVNIHDKDVKDEIYSLDVNNKKGLGVRKGWRRPIFEKISNTLTQMENHLSNLDRQGSSSI